MEVTPSEQFIDVRGTRVRVLTAGDGPSLLYLHGSGDSGEWLPVLGSLAAQFRVIRPDHPGFNGSDDSSAVDSVHDLAFHTLDLMASLGLERVNVVGSSLGGWVSLDLATLEPHRVEKLIVVGSAGMRVEGAAGPDVFMLSPAELAELLFHNAEHRAPAVAAARRLDGDQDAMRAYLRNRVATAHLAWNPYFHDPKLAHRLHRITAPVLLIWGLEDRIIPLAHGERWVQLLPGSRLEVMPDCGHLPQVERPGLFTELVARFLGAPAVPG